MFYLESALPDQVLIERAIDTWYSEKYGWRRSGDCTDACSYTQVICSGISFSKIFFKAMFFF